MSSAPNKRLSIAPMIEVTDRSFRFMMRWITKETHLYTEMVHSRAVIADPKRYLGYSQSEHPLILQLGGDDRAEVARAARYGAEVGYDEINLNCGCPSERVKRGGFGACLMAEPSRVASLVEGMRESGLPVSVKHRIGIAESGEGIDPDYGKLFTFVRTLHDAGCDRFIVHARMAILGGLSPAENRSVPPLNYQFVLQLKNDFKNASFEINGGIMSLEQSAELLTTFDGVMIVRADRDNPMMFFCADSLLDAVRSGESISIPSDLNADPWRVAECMIDHVEASPDMARIVSRHLLNLFHGYAGARRYRRFLSENLPETDHKDVAQLLREAVARVERRMPSYEPEKICI